MRRDSTESGAGDGYEKAAGSGGPARSCGLARGGEKRGGPAKSGRQIHAERRWRVAVGTGRSGRLAGSGFLAQRPLTAGVLTLGCILNRIAANAVSSLAQAQDYVRA